MMSLRLPPLAQTPPLVVPRALLSIEMFLPPSLLMGFVAAAIFIEYEDGNIWTASLLLIHDTWLHKYNVVDHSYNQQLVITLVEEDRTTLWCESHAESSWYRSAIFKLCEVAKINGFCDVSIYF
jgi:hypothetical protein